MKKQNGQTIGQTKKMKGTTLNEKLKENTKGAPFKGKDNEGYSIQSKSDKTI